MRSFMKSAGSMGEAGGNSMGPVLGPLVAKTLDTPPPSVLFSAPLTARDEAPQKADLPSRTEEAFSRAMGACDRAGKAIQRADKALHSENEQNVEGKEER